MAEVLAQVMKEETGSANTHPALQDRLAALRQDPCLPEPLTDSAADVLLKGQQEGLVQQLSQEWSARVQEGWGERYEYVKTSLSRIEELKGRQQQNDFTAEQAYDYAKLSEEFFPDTDAVDNYRAVVKLRETHVSAQYALGQLLLGQGNEEGISRIERAMTLDPEARLDGCREVYHFLKERDRTEEAAVYEQRFQERVELEEKIDEERGDLCFQDTYVAHDAEQEVVQSLVEQLRGYRKISRAYFVRKQTEFSDQPLYVLGVQRPWYWWHWFFSDDSSTRLKKQLLGEISFQGEIFILVLDQGHPKFRRMFSQIPESCIYERQGGGGTWLMNDSKSSRPQPSQV